MQTIHETLQAQFGIEDVLNFQAGPGGLVQAAIANRHAEAKIFLQGAHVAHFQPRGQAPVLWMSDSSWFEAGKPIRGGIPICFPWFGPHPGDPQLPAHGFARTQAWAVRQAAQEPGGETRLVLGLLSNAETFTLWPHTFDLELTVVVGAQLDVGFAVKNTSSAPFTFGEALHTYLTVSDIRKVEIRGLAGVSFIDRMRQNQRLAEGAAPLAISAETDRVYLNTQGRCTVADLGLRRQIHCDKRGSNSTVVWNPWINKAKAMKDFGDEEWPGMLCIETANALDNLITLKPGETHAMHAILGVQA